MTGRARVLLVDDDPSMRRFVEMVLEELDLELVLATSVDDALEELRRGPVAALLTDLMMPGRNGLDLLKQLDDEPSLRGDARVIVLSAGLTPTMQERLDAFAVWRRIIKPVSVAELEACVREAVAGGEPRMPSAPAPRRVPDPFELTPAELEAIDLHFAGDRGLFVAFRDSSLPQVQLDLQAGRSALNQGDLTALRHLAHNLKSVLTLLGCGGPADIARTLENALIEGFAQGASALWQDLQDSLAGEGSISSPVVKPAAARTDR